MPIVRHLSRRDRLLAKYPEDERDDDWLHRGGSIHLAGGIPVASTSKWIHAIVRPAQNGADTSGRGKTTARSAAIPRSSKRGLARIMSSIAGFQPLLTRFARRVTLFSLRQLSRAYTRQDATNGQDR